MAIVYKKNDAVFSDVVSVEDAEALLEWLQKKSAARVDLSACTHLHPANLQVLVGMLKEHGHRVRPVLDGRLALRAAKAEVPDLVIAHLSDTHLTSRGVLYNAIIDPAAALDPISSGRIEDLIHELKNDYAIVIVTHNMQQAARVADRTAFFSVEPAEQRDANPHGVLIEIGETLHIFTSPSDPRTEAYVTGRFG